MPYKISGWNSFYEGWLARCFEQPNNTNQDEAWQRGWRMGDETDEDGRMVALCEEIKMGQAGIAKPKPHIIVNKI